MYGFFFFKSDCQYLQNIILLIYKSPPKNYRIEITFLSLFFRLLLA